MRKFKLLKPSFIRHDKRGSFIELTDSFKAKTIITGEMKKGSVLGGHYHKKTDIVFYITKGEASVNLVFVKSGKKDHITLHSEEGIVIPVGYLHTITAVVKSTYILAKSLVYDQKDLYTV